jgi:hypothetical protein
VRQSRSNPPKGNGRTARSAKRKPFVLAALPALDWPSDLFADNAPISDLIEEDFAFPDVLFAAQPRFQDGELLVHTSH